MIEQPRKTFSKISTFRNTLISNDSKFLLMCIRSRDMIVLTKIFGRHQDKTQSVSYILSHLSFSILTRVYLTTCVFRSHSMKFNIFLRQIMWSSRSVRDKEKPRDPKVSRPPLILKKKKSDTCKAIMTHFEREITEP